MYLKNMVSSIQTRIVVWLFTYPLDHWPEAESCIKLSRKYCLANFFAKQKLSGAPPATILQTNSKLWLVACFCEAILFCA